METLSMSDYRSNMSTYFDMAQMGEEILIKRYNQVFALKLVDVNHAGISPELQHAIDSAREEYRAGKCVVCHNKQELHNLLDSL